MADRVIRLDCNYGSYNQLIVGFAIETEFTYIHDDDMVPGSKLLEHYLTLSVASGSHRGGGAKSGLNPHRRTPQVQTGFTLSACHRFRTARPAPAL